MGDIGAGFILIFLLVLPLVQSFYLPGVAPRDFQKGDTLQVKVNKLSSTKTQLPYDHYFLDYCTPVKIQNSAENLGEVLRGDRIENSVYMFNMRNDETCKVGCRKKFTAESAKNFKEKIDDEYKANMYVSLLKCIYTFSVSLYLNILKVIYISSEESSSSVLPFLGSWIISLLQFEGK